MGSFRFVSTQQLTLKLPLFTFELFPSKKDVNEKTKRITLNFPSATMLRFLKKPPKTTPNNSDALRYVNVLTSS